MIEAQSWNTANNFINFILDEENYKKFIVEQDIKKVIK